MKDASAIFSFLLEAKANGERTALVTITDVVGSSTRAPGTHMAVTESGAWRGSFSGGCVEAAVIGEAQRVIAEGEAKSIRFGAGSPLIDIRLPCGGGMDLLFVPQPSGEALRQALDLLAARSPIALRMALDGSVLVVPSTLSAVSSWDRDTFVAHHAPDLRLLLIGHGTEILALARFGLCYRIPVTVLSPDATIVEAVGSTGQESFLLKTPARSPHLAIDHRTAVVFLFHDHDWEAELLAQTLEQDAFYVGAMGSKRTHEHRVAGLLDRGVPAPQVARIVGPIGQIPATRDPDTLALSILAQIVGLAGSA